MPAGAQITRRKAIALIQDFGQAGMYEGLQDGCESAGDGDKLHGPTRPTHNVWSLRRTTQIPFQKVHTLAEATDDPGERGVAEPCKTEHPSHLRGDFTLAFIAAEVTGGAVEVSRQGVTPPRRLAQRPRDTSPVIFCQNGDDERELMMAELDAVTALAWLCPPQLRHGDNDRRCKQTKEALLHIAKARDKWYDFQCRHLVLSRADRYAQ